MRSLLLLLTFALPACAPIYAPSAFHVPLHQKAGDVHLGVHGGTQGFVANAAYAATDAIALRGTFHYADRDGFYRLYDAGVGYYWAGRATEPTEGQFDSGMRGSLNLDLGAGNSRGTTQLGVGRISLSGSFFRTALQADLGYEWEYAAVALVGRGVYLRFTHDEHSDLPERLAHNVIFEPGVLARIGTRAVKLELQLGGSVGMNLTGEFGTWFPLIFSVGLVGDF